jgi:hypothetical protein
MDGVPAPPAANTCGAKTVDGSPCRRRIPSSEKYCYQHSIGFWNKIRYLHNNKKAAFWTTIILTVILSAPTWLPVQDVISAIKSTRVFYGSLGNISVQQAIRRLTPVPPASAHAVTTKAPQPQSFKQLPSLIFADSLIFTSQRKKHIQEDIGAFESYLRNIGFDVTLQIPPIEIRPGKGLAMSATSPGFVYDRKIIIGAQGIDDSSIIRRAYAQYYFSTIIGGFGELGTPSAAISQLADVYEVYFLDDYLGMHKRSSIASSSKWVDALWDVRKRFGAEMTDKALFIGIQRRNEIVKIENTDGYIKQVIEHGFLSLLNDPTELQEIEIILEANGLMQTPPTLHDVFKGDFADIGGISDNGFDLRSPDGDTIHIDRRVLLDFPGKNEFIALYIPSTQHGFEICLAVAGLIQPMVSTLASRLDVTGGDSGGMTDIKDLRFSGRVFIYHEWPLSNKQKADITEAYSAKNLDVQFRGLEYLLNARRK